MKLKELNKKKDAAEHSLAEGGSDDITTTPDNLLEYITEIDDAIAECKKHVEMHTKQRDLYNRYEREAAECIKNNVPLDEMTAFAVIDMGRNAATRFLGSNQMGDFYYMSPLIHYIFGISKPMRKFTHHYI